MPPYNSNSSTGADTGTASYTDAEKEYLKQSFRSEYHLLMTHGLSIYRDEDREEGRRILRALMQGDDGPEKQSGTRRDAEKPKPKPKPSEASSSARANPRNDEADLNFSNRQLAAINRNYGSAATFMMSYGLKPYNDEDCREAAAIARELFGR